MARHPPRLQEMASLALAANHNAAAESSSQALIGNLDHAVTLRQKALQVLHLRTDQPGAVSQQQAEQDPAVRDQNIKDLQTLVKVDVPFIPLRQYKDYGFSQA